MIPAAFYETKYQYDRGMKRWIVKFISNEIESFGIAYPLVDGVVRVDGDNVVCSVEETLALIFLQSVENVMTLQQQESARLQEEAAAKQRESQGPLDVPVSELPISE